MAFSEKGKTISLGTFLQGWMNMSPTDRADQLDCAMKTYPPWRDKGERFIHDEPNLIMDGTEYLELVKQNAPYFPDKDKDMEKIIEDNEKVAVVVQKIEAIRAAAAENRRRPFFPTELREEFEQLGISIEWKHFLNCYCTNEVNGRLILLVSTSNGGSANRFFRPVMIKPDQEYSAVRSMAFCFRTCTGAFPRYDTLMSIMSAFYIPKGHLKFLRNQDLSSNQFSQGGPGNADHLSTNGRPSLGHDLIYGDQNNHNGDQIGGDRFGGDQVGGDQVGGDRFGGDRFGGNQIGGNQVNGLLGRDIVELFNVFSKLSNPSPATNDFSGNANPNPSAAYPPSQQHVVTQAQATPATLPHPSVDPPESFKSIEASQAALANSPNVSGESVPVASASGTPSPAAGRERTLSPSALTAGQEHTMSPSALPAVVDAPTKLTYQLLLESQCLKVETKDSEVCLGTVEVLTQKWDSQLANASQFAVRHDLELQVTLDLSDVIWTITPVGSKKSFFKLLLPFFKKVCAFLAELRLDGINHTVSVNAAFESLKQFNAVFKKSPVLKTLSLAGIALGSDGLYCLKSILELPSLEKLDLSNTGIAGDVPLQLCKLLSSGHEKNPPALKSLIISRNTMGDEGGKGMAKLLPILRNLECLEYSSCVLGFEGTHHLMEGLKEFAGPKLKGLNLSNAVFSTKEEDFEGLALEGLKETLPALIGLEKLILSDAALGPKGIEIVANGLYSSSCKLKVLDLSNNRGTDQDEQSFANSSPSSFQDSCNSAASSLLGGGKSPLPDSPDSPDSPNSMEGSCFKTESSNGSPVTFRGNRALLQRLFKSDLSCLAELNLAGNMIGDTWTANLVPQILLLPQLELLDLTSNSLGDMTAKSDFVHSFCRHVSVVSSKIYTLKLGKNRLGDEAACLLVNNCCKHLMQLQELHLESTFSKTLVAEQLKRAPSSLKVLDLSGNKLSTGDMIELKQKYFKVILDEDQKRKIELTSATTSATPAAFETHQESPPQTHKGVPTEVSYSKKTTLTAAESNTAGVPSTPVPMQAPAPPVALAGDSQFVRKAFAVLAKNFSEEHLRGMGFASIEDFVESLTNESQLQDGTFVFNRRAPLLERFLESVAMAHLRPVGRAFKALDNEIKLSSKANIALGVFEYYRKNPDFEALDFGRASE